MGVGSFIPLEILVKSVQLEKQNYPDQESSINW